MGDQHELLEGSFLSPRNDVEVGDFQSALLNKAFESESVKNIAITGPVGCGKSSFIKSYEAAYGKRFAYLSLADFDYRNMDKGKDAEDSECVKSLNALERKIIDQLSVVSNSNSSIKWVKTEYPSAKVSFNARALAMAFVAFLVVTVIALALCVQVVSHPFAGESSAYPIGITAALLVLLIVGLSVWYVKSGCPPIVKSLSLEGVRAEVESDVKSCSYFDEHLSFIIELFDAREEDAFVFEDLDRLSQSEILGQLRELNLTLNLARGSAIKPIRFVYCLADDVLLGESRTKFFDLMIPVVPIVDGYNSYGRIVEQLSGFPGDLSNQLLLNTAFYIDDYRLLKSIVTDYCVYADELNAQKQTCFDYSKLFAMMAIKNVAPSVFIDLERRRGALYKYLKDLSGENVDPVFLRPHGFKKILDPYCKTSFSESGFPDGYIENVVEFLSYLIKSGFVDEGYYFYIARPDSKRLSDRDRAWLMMARNGSSNYQWALDAPESVLEYLHDYEFLKPSTMNLSLAEYMSTSCSTENQAFKNMIECAFGEASDFGSLAVSRLPRFPFSVIERIPDFLLSEGNFDKSLFVLSVVSGSLLQGTMCAEQVDSEPCLAWLLDADAMNNGAIARVLSDSAGLYSPEQITLFGGFGSLCDKGLA
ncbi:hypothetical protein AAY81_06410 [Denitrobacterium detoxificans]|uniref:YobI-like P-loop NTPase domain-containing protein n=1 Tax=Denitrobacterium detoxificans TaxID=79604 RepID=A0A172RYS8_9ACTN|nr:ATP-binding protein [Denitrobacterium detoxificans]ANE22815.1 hypothetical protein AAY81_06410 [Denitrobacterium detoxificans]SEO68220.1 hypothetical protein SAMN02910314_00846 [Denitrobacterium detoxificans]